MLCELVLQVGGKNASFENNLLWDSVCRTIQAKKWRDDGYYTSEHCRDQYSKLTAATGSVEQPLATLRKARIAELEAAKDHVEKLREECQEDQAAIERGDVDGVLAAFVPPEPSLKRKRDALEVDVKAKPQTNGADNNETATPVDNDDDDDTALNDDDPEDDEMPTLESPEQMRTALLSVVTQIRKHDDAVPFLAPVDPRDVPDYSQYIKEPMDLLTIRKLVESSEVSSPEKLSTKLTLMFENAFTYNHNKSEIYQMAKRLKVLSADLIKSTFPQKRKAALSLEVNGDAGSSTRHSRDSNKRGASTDKRPRTSRRSSKQNPPLSPLNDEKRPRGRPRKYR